MTTPSHSPKQTRRAQRGYGSLVAIAIIGVAATTMLVTTLSATALRNEQARKSNGSLTLARQALIGRAASDVNRPGSLPCPDLDNDGLLQSSGEIFGNCASNIGRLPWRTLGLPDLRDADGERLWYAVSPNFNDVTGNVINSATAGQLSVSGAMTVNYAAAIVFSPGALVGNQNRSDTGVNTASNYLESLNENPNTFTLHNADSSHNDQLAVISPADIWIVAEKRLAQDILAALNSYYTANGNLFPWPASSGCAGSGDSYNASACTPVAPYPGTPYTYGSIPSSVTGPAWFDPNQWRSLVHMYVDSNCVSPNWAPSYGSPHGTCGSFSMSFVQGSGKAINIANTKGMLYMPGVYLGGNMYDYYKTQYYLALQ